MAMLPNMSPCELFVRPLYGQNGALAIPLTAYLPKSNEPIW